MSAVVSKAAIRRLASVPSTSSAPIQIQKRLLSTTSKRALPLYFYSDHSPAPSTPTSTPASGSNSHITTTHASSPDHHIHSANMHSSTSAGGFSQAVQHAFDPPPTSGAGYATATPKPKMDAQRVYRPALEEYDYMSGGSGYGHESGVNIK